MEDLNALLIQFRHEHPEEIYITDFDDKEEQFTILLDRQGAVRLLSEIVSAVTSDGEKPNGAEDFSQSFYYLINHMHTKYGGESIGSLIAGLNHVIMIMQESGNEDSEDITESDYTIIVNQFGANAVAIEDKK